MRLLRILTVSVPVATILSRSSEGADDATPGAPLAGAAGRTGTIVAGADAEGSAGTARNGG